MFIGLFFLSAQLHAAEVEVLYSDTIVSGFPFPAKMVVRGPITIIRPGLFSPGNPFFISLAGEKGDFVFPKEEYVTIIADHTITPPQPDINMPIPKITIPENEEQEYTLDFSILECIDQKSKYRIKGWQIPPGKYRIEFSLPGVLFNFENKYIDIIEPSTEEAKILEEIAKASIKHVIRKRSQQPSKWEKFILDYKDIPPNTDFIKMSTQSKEQMEYYLLLAQLVNSDEGLGHLSLPIEDPKEFNPLIETDVLMLKYEIDFAKGSNHVDLDRTYSKIKAKRPDTKQLTLENQEWLGVIKDYRRQIREQSKEMEK